MHQTARAKLIVFGMIAALLAVARAYSPSVEQLNSQSATLVEHATPALEVGFTPPPNVTGQSAWIPLRYQEQESNLCVPTSASIILEYFGEQVSPRELKELSLGRRYSPDMPFNDFTITLFRDLIFGLHSIGYSWKEIDFPDNRKGLQHGLAQIEHSLDAGIPASQIAGQQKPPAEMIRHE